MSNAGSQDLVHASHVRLAYRALLGREATQDEVRIQLAGLTTVGQLLDVLTASPEFSGSAQVLLDPHPGPARVNIWHEDLADWTHPVGSTSPDGVALVGREGWLFIQGGTNSNLAQHTGEVTMAAGWADQWRALIEARCAAADRLGVRLAQLIIPDKLAIEEAHLPEPIEIRGLRPALRLTEELGLPIVYPVADMQAAKRNGPAYLRTDSHCSLVGNDAIHRALCAELGAEPLPSDHIQSATKYVSSGDLGRRFDPAIVEVMRSFLSLGHAEIADDNRDVVAARGGHIGSRRVFSNSQAPRDEVAVIFGDSYGFAGPGYEGVSWFLAQLFREVHFVWTPFGWDDRYVERVQATVVVSQTAERFVNRVPLERVDVDELVARATGHGPTIDPDAVFDAPA
jgi:hypothetical protein